MLEFVIGNIAMITFGAILYVAVKSASRIEGQDEVKRGFFERLVMSEIPEKVDRVANAFLLKFLRKSKVWVLKIDNTIAKRLEHMKFLSDKDAKFAVDLKEMIDEPEKEPSPPVKLVSVDLLPDVSTGQKPRKRLARIPKSKVS